MRPTCKWILEQLFLSDVSRDRCAHGLTAAPTPHCAQTLISHNLCVQTFSHGRTKGEFTVSWIWDRHGKKHFH